MFSGRHISVSWTIMGRSSLCYLMNGLNLMKGRRLGLGPKSDNATKLQCFKHKRKRPEALRPCTV